MTTTKTQTKPFGWIVAAAAAAAAAAAVFAFDLMTPLGLAVPMLYGIPLLMTWFVPGLWSTFLMIGIAMLLTWGGTALSTGELTADVVANRSMASALLLVIGWLVIKRKRLAKQRDSDQASLRESEERYALVIMGAEAGIWDWNVPEKRVFFSPRWKALRGLAEDEVSDHETEWSSRIHPDDRERVMAAVCAHFEGRTAVFAEEYRVRHKDGRWIWILDHGMAKRDSAGKVVRMAGSETDITERKRAEEGLRKAQKLLQDTEKIGHVGGWEFDINTRKQTWTDEVYRIHEVSREFEPTVDKGIAFYASESKSTIERVVQRAIEFGEAFDVELEFITAKGNRRWVHAIGERDVEGHRVHGFFQDITAHKRAEEALRESEEQFRSLFENAASGMAQIDVNGRFINVNDRFCQITGYSRDELLSKMGPLDLDHPDDVEADRQRIADFFHAKLPYLFIEKRYVHKVGNIVWVRVTVAPIRDNHGNVSTTVAVIEDVTERKRMEAVLRESEERFRTMAEAVPSFLFETDAAGGNIWTSEGWCRFTGQTQEQVAGHGWAEALHPDDRSTNIDRWMQCLKDGVPFESQQRLRRRDGVYVWVIARALPVRDSQGKVSRWVGSVTNVDDIVRVQEALRDSEERFAKAFRASPNPIGITEMATGRCIEVNEACLQLFGFCREEVIGNTTLMLGIWPSQEDRAQLVERLKAGEPVRNLELSFRTKSGELRHILVSSDVAELSGTLCLITVGNDITDRKRAEDQMRRTATDLAEAQRITKLGSWRFDVASDRIVLSDQLCRMFNVEPSPLGEPYESFLALVHPDDRPGVVQANIEARAHGTPFDVEFRIMTADGSVKTMRELGYASKDSADRVVGLFGTLQDITERKEAEEKLRASEELLRAVTNSLTDHIAVLDKQGAIIAVNEAWVRFSLANNSERSPDQWVGVNYFDVCREAGNHDEMAWHVLQGLEGVRDGSRPFFEFEYPCHSETEQRWFSLKVTPLSGTEGGLVVYHENITERKHAEVVLQEARTMLEQRVRERTAQLAEANERWDWVVRATNDGVWDWDLVRDVAYFSPRWKEMHGFQTSDQPESRKEWEARIHPEDRQSVLDRLEAYLRGEWGEFWEEYRVQRKDGAYIWVLDRGVAIRDEKGQAVRMVGAETDIAWRKGVEQALRFREQQFHALADNVPAHFAYIDRSRRYQFLNKHCEALFQRPAEALQGMSVQDLLGPEDYAKLKPILDQALAGEPVSFEYRRQSPEDGMCYLSGQYVPDRDDQGNVRGVLALMTDITPLKSNEALLRAREAQLRELGAKLLRAQEEERRRISRDLHDDVMQRMGALALELYGLASSISSQDEELQSQLKAFGASAEQLTTDLQRMAHQLHPSVLEFGGLETALREQVHDFGARTGISAEFITKDVPKDIPLDHATCLYRILQEGLQNVQKHAEATTVLVRLMRTGRGLGLCIHDDGRGVENVDGATQRKGLGLTSMAERVGMLNGVFRIRAKPGEGTELHAWVPLEGG